MHTNTVIGDAGPAPGTGDGRQSAGICARSSKLLPSPKGKPFSLYVRTHWPDAAVLDGTWTPPKVEPIP